MAITICWQDFARYFASLNSSGDAHIILAGAGTRREYWLFRNTNKALAVYCNNIEAEAEANDE